MILVFGGTTEGKKVATLLEGLAMPFVYSTKTNISFEETEVSKKFKNSDFGYNKITIDRPLRLSCQFTQEKVASLRFNTAFVCLQGSFPIIW